MIEREANLSETSARTIFWAGVWLAAVLVATKAYYLTTPAAILWAGGPSVRSLAAISYLDVLFAAALWACGRAVLAVAGRSLFARVTSGIFVACGAIACLYAVANIMLFGILGGFLTYHMFALVGDMGMLRSSVAAYLTPRAAGGLICLPLVYVALVLTTARCLRPRRAARVAHGWPALVGLVVWVVFGHYAFTTHWATRQGRSVADSAHWVLVSSWWRGVGDTLNVRLADRFGPGDLTDFEPIGRQLVARAGLVPTTGSLESLTGRTGRALGRRRPPNVILVVLESVAARWVSLHSSLYDTTPTLVAEARRGIVFDSFYAHIGRSSNSLAAMLLSAYPKLDFRDMTEQYPRLPGTSLASVFRDRGYRTAFITPSDLSWAGWNQFLERRGFDEIRDRHGLPCTLEISSWGVEDRCMVDGMIDFIGRDPAHPFFLMGWTTQTHHPYEPTPGVPMLDLVREHGPDDWDLGRYLNVLHETDRQLGRLFEAVRRAGLEKDTLVVITGDHGQAFGYPHDSYTQGRTVYEEDVHVPLMFWFPRIYQSARRSNTIGAHIDLAPTIADLAGMPSMAEWQGRSLFDKGRVPRAYFYVAEERFALGIREDNWKYIVDLREGIEQLYDLERDPTERQNLASAYPERCARLRQRLAAWTEANGRQYAGG